MTIKEINKIVDKINIDELKRDNVIECYINDNANLYISRKNHKIIFQVLQWFKNTNTYEIISKFETRLTCDLKDIIEFGTDIVLNQ